MPAPLAAPLAALGAKLSSKFAARLAARIALDQLFNSDLGRIFMSAAIGVAVLLLLLYGTIVSRFSAVSGYSSSVARADTISGDQMALYQAGAAYLDGLLYGEDGGGTTPDHLWMLARLVNRDASAANVGTLVCELGTYSGYGSFPSMVDAWQADHAPAARSSLMTAALVESERMWGNPSAAAAFREARRTSAFCDTRWTGIPGCVPAEPRPSLALGQSGQPVPPRGVVCAVPDLTADWGAYDWSAPNAGTQPRPPFAALGTPAWDPRWRLQAGW